MTGRVIPLQGSLLEASERIVIHGCNDKGVMGKGLALAVKEHWPEVFKVYQYAYASGGMGLGEVYWADVDGKRIGNLISQHGFGTSPTVRYVSYDALDKGLRAAAVEAQRLRQDSVALPFIGAGLGGGCPAVIYELIREVARSLSVNFHVYLRSADDLAQFARVQRETIE